MKKTPIETLADRVCAKYGPHVTEREKEFSRHGFAAGHAAAMRRFSKRRIMAVLDAVFEDGGYKLTVRSYNKILTGLGCRLSNPR